MAGKSGPMDDAKFKRMLGMSVIYVDLMKSRQFFEGLDESDTDDKHVILNCLEIVADTFVEMQRRLGVKAMFRSKARTTQPHRGGSDG
jgi:hypothetical protein